MNIGIDHGYSAVKTRHFSFPAGISAYSYEPYTLQNTLEYGGQIPSVDKARKPAYLLFENVPYALQHIRHVMNRNQLCIAPP